MTTQLSPPPEATPAPTHAPAEATVQVRGVEHSFGSGENRNTVLRDNNLDLYPGEIVILTGKSGSGKTTLLTLIGGLRRLQRGSIRVWGRDLGGLSDPELAAYRKRVGFIFQAHNLFGSLTAQQNVRLALELEGGTAAEMDRRAVELLERLDLKERVAYKPQGLSGGQRQRVAIARALANDPRLILADEPTAALDEASALLVVGLLRERARQGATIIIVTHDNKILDAADRIVNMSYGSIVSDSNVRLIQELCQFLKSCECFSDLTPAELSDQAARMTPEVHPDRAAIIRQGERGDRFYLIYRGTVEVLVEQDGSTRTVAELGRGQFFGETALLYDRPRNATVVARGPVELYSLNEADFKAALAASPSLDAQIRALLAQRQ